METVLLIALLVAVAAFGAWDSARCRRRGNDEKRSPKQC